MEERFVADSMLGRLSKWLRVMGYDTHYQPFFKEGVIQELVHGGHKLLSRHRATIILYPNSMLILSDHVRDQLHEMKKEGAFTADRSKWFTRCLTCNVPLREAEAEDTRANIPEYVFHRHTSEIRFCPSCGRYFWPGSHRGRMIKQLEEWGF